jgi:hypothetical protein
VDRSGGEVGKWFRVLRGPFADFSGQLVESSDDGSVLLLINAFGRETPVRVPREDLGDGGGDAARVREPRKPAPSSDEMAAAPEDD